MSRRRSKGVVVMKFGGTSVENAAAIRGVAEIVRSRAPENPVVVVSALARVTDQLDWLGEAASTGRLPAALDALPVLHQRHQQVCGQLVAAEDYAELQSYLDSEFYQLERLLRESAEAGDLGPQKKDELLSLGERVSSTMVTAAFLRAGLKAVLVDARECIVTNDVHTQASPLWEETRERLQCFVRPWVEEGCIPVLGGFVGVTRDGVTTTLGRGGSDFSAAIVGVGLDAERIEIWTDVDGVMSTDPRLCADAQRISVLSFEEAAELAHFGAKILHPATLAPAARKNIPVRVLNSRNPRGEGTQIVAEPDDRRPGVTAITAKRGVAVVDVKATQAMNAETLQWVCSVLERHGVGIDLVSASRSSVSLLVNSVTALPAVATELQPLATVQWENHQALVCLVGDKLRRRPEIASLIFGAVADLHVRIVCQGASERNISFLVEDCRAEEAVQRLHGLLFPPLEANATRGTSNTLCQAGGEWR